MLKHFSARLSAFWFLLMLSFSSLAIDLDRAGDFELSPFIEYRQEDSALMNASVADISRVDDWQRSTTGNLNFGFQDQPYWFKATINSQRSDLDWFIRIIYPPLDHIYVYLCQFEAVNNVEDECELYHAGDRIAFDERMRSNPNHIIPVSLNPGNNYLYLKVDTSSSYQLPISILDKQSLDDYLAINDFFRGAYLSLMLVMILYNLFIFLMTRSSTYFLYSAFVLSFLIFHMTYEGSGFQYLWPDMPQWNIYALPIAFSVNQICTILFITAFLNIKQTSRPIFNYLNVLLAISFMSLLLVPIIPYKSFIPLMNLVSLTISGSAFYLGLKYWREGQSSARFFTIAWAVLTIGMMTANLKTLGVVPSNFFTRYGYQIGSFLEIVLLSLALGERIQRLQQEHILSKQALFQEKQDRMTALKQLIIGISHEMNTPIGNIALSNSFLLELNEELKAKLARCEQFNSLDQSMKQELLDYIDQQNEAIHTIKNSKKTLGELTHVFSNISVNKTDHPATEFDLVHLIQDRMLTYQTKIKFDASLPEHCLIISHPSAFILVLNQSFDNVIDHVANSSTDNDVVKPKVSITLEQSKENLRLVISDNGNRLLQAGLKQEDLIQLFLPFYTNARGTQKKMGLGMYQMQNIVTDLLKGKIEASLNEKGGLVLTLSLNISTY